MAMDRTDLIARRDLALNYILRSIDPAGRFAYCVDSRNGQPLAGYNLLRPCGTIWAALNTPGVGRHARLDAAIGYLLGYVQPYRDGGAVIDRQGFAKLGAAGLALLALTDYRRGEIPRAVDEKCALAVSQMIKFVVAMHRARGDFAHKINVRTGEVSDFHSDYYTGEALFGVIHALQLTPALDQEPAGDHASRRDFVKSVIARLNAQDYGVRAQSHWMLYALEALDRTDRTVAYLDYAGRIVQNMLDRPGYRARRRNTPIACRTEGFLAYLRMVHARPPGAAGLWHDARAARTRQATEENLREQIGFQIADRAHELAGGFICGDDDPTIRIDFVQHNLSAINGYLELADASP